MTQIERVEHYEGLLNVLTAAQDALEQALEDFEAAQPLAEELAAYYGGELWRRDFEDDEAGRLPDGLRRGVVSEDGICDALERNRELLEQVGK